MIPNLRSGTEPQLMCNLPDSSDCRSQAKLSTALVSCLCARVLFDVMHLWAKCLDSRLVWLPETEVPAGWG